MSATDVEEYTLEEAAAVLDLDAVLVRFRLQSGSLQSLRRSDVEAMKPVLEEQARLMIEINDDFDEYHKIVNDGLRIKWMPMGPGFRVRDLDRYEAFLDSSDAEQAEFLKTVDEDEVEFWLELLTARAMYVHPDDKRDGSITEAKVARHPERYDWPSDE
ncbi:hypothetical protein AB4Z52_29375 [Rhizobium sp. 2YAF20]|uniref:hypothetical protein n=1 Tax=Rhizobium sp. 2YAF20 TaxID=3233027 RepID=UPI003F9D4984